MSGDERTRSGGLGPEAHPRLRHDAARRGAGAWRGPHGRGEAGGRPSARASQRGRHRGGLPGRLARRLGGGPPHRQGDQGRGRGRPRALPRRRPAARGRGDPRGRASPPTRLHRDLRHPPQAQAARHPRGGAGGSRGVGPLWAQGARPGCRDRVQRRGCLAHGPGVPAAHLRGSRRCRCHDGQYPRHRRLRHPGRVRGAGRLGRRPRGLGGRGQRPLPQRPRPGHGQHPGCRPGRRSPGRGDHQRPRRACRQRVARRGRHVVAHAADAVPRRSPAAWRRNRSPPPAAWSAT